MMQDSEALSAPCPPTNPNATSSPGPSQQVIDIQSSSQTPDRKSVYARLPPSRLPNVNRFYTASTPHTATPTDSPRAWHERYIGPWKFSGQKDSARNDDIELGNTAGMSAGEKQEPVISNLDGTVEDPKPRDHIRFRTKNKTYPQRTHPAHPKPDAIAEASHPISKEALPKAGSDEKQLSWFRRHCWFPTSPNTLDFLRLEWPDLLTLLVCLILPLLIFKLAHPLTPRYFPITSPGMDMYSYPVLTEYINTWVSAVLSFGVPFAVMGLMSILLIGDYWDCNSATMGLSYALCTTNVFQIFLKLFFGGLRPHFLTLCQPPLYPSGVGFSSIYHTSSVCTMPPTSASMMSFPSGHSAAAFAGFLFLSLWLNAKLKIHADYHSRHWQQIAFMLPLLFASLISLSKIADYWHHWWDVLVGAIIGSFFAVLSYRQVYCSVWDWRTNHIPLPYPWELSYTDPVNHPVTPHRDLTAINFAGWRNKYSPPDTPPPRDLATASNYPPQALSTKPNIVDGNRERPVDGDMEKTKKAGVPVDDKLRVRKIRKETLAQVDGASDEEKVDVVEPMIIEEEQVEWERQSKNEDEKMKVRMRGGTCGEGRSEAEKHVKMRRIDMTNFLY